MAADLLERITVNPEVRFGKPCVRGTRITVGEVLGFLAAGGSEAELLEELPQLSHEVAAAPGALERLADEAIAEYRKTAPHRREYGVSERTPANGDRAWRGACPPTRDCSASPRGPASP